MGGFNIYKRRNFDLYKIKDGFSIIKFFFIVYLFIFNFKVLAHEYHPKLIISDIVEKINNKNNVLYFNSEILDEKNSFKQVYYKDIVQNRYFSFQKGVVEYSFLNSDGVESYGYAEHFYDCLNSEKVIYRQKYNNQGDFFSSEVLLVDLNKYRKDFDKSVCNDLKFYGD